MSGAQMRAACLVEFNKPYQIKEKVVPEPGPHEILIEVVCAGFCHSDVLIANGEAAYTKPEVTACHEASGFLRKMGNKVDQSRFKLGDRVTASGNMDLPDSCADCQNGNPSTCGVFNFLGASHDGTMADYVVADSRLSVVIPDNLSHEKAAPLTCAGLTVYHALNVAGLKAGQTVGIVGLGALGSLGVQIAKAKGYKVVGVDARPEPLELVKSFGKNSADYVLNALKDTNPRDVLPADVEIDAVIFCTDNVKGIPYATSILKHEGVFVCVGMVSEPGYIFSKIDIIFRRLQIRGSLMGTRQELQELCELVAKGEVSSPMTYLDGLDRLNELVEMSHRPTSAGKYGIRLKKDI